VVSSGFLLKERGACGEATDLSYIVQMGPAAMKLIMPSGKDEQGLQAAVAVYVKMAVGLSKGIASYTDMVLGE